MIFDSAVTITSMRTARVPGIENFDRYVSEFVRPVTLYADLPLVEASHVDKDVGIFTEDDSEYNKLSSPTGLDRGVKEEDIGAYTRKDSMMLREAKLTIKKKHLMLEPERYGAEVTRQLTAKIHNTASSAEKDILYGDMAKDAKSIFGLYSRYSHLTDLEGVVKSGDYAGYISPYITIDAGGTSDGNLGSMWFIVPSADGVCLIYPKGSQFKGITYDAGQMETGNDEKDGEIRKRVDFIYHAYGISVRNRNCCIRVANIDFSDDTSMKKLMQALYDAFAVIPQSFKSRMIAYAPYTALGKLNYYFDSLKVANTYENAKPENIGGDITLSGIGYIRPCNSLTLHESQVV